MGARILAGDALGWNRWPYEHHSVYSSGGEFAIWSDNISDWPDGWETFDPVAGSMTADAIFSSYSSNESFRESAVRFWGFAYADFSEGSLPVIARVVIVPHWFVFGASVLLAVALVRRRRRLGRRFFAGHCRACGYDLRATPGRCPECGTVVWASAAR